MADPGNLTLIPADARPLLVSTVRDLLGALVAESIASPIAPYLAEWPPGRRQQMPAGTSQLLPVLRWMEEFAADEKAFGRSLIAELRCVARDLAWRQTYTAAEVGEEFLHDYGWTEIVGASATHPGTCVACGFLLLGPWTRYPPHCHAAEEIYVPLSGAAHWQQGDAPWRERHPGSVIQHASQEPHAMATGSQPLLALYLWRGSTTASRLC